MLSHTGQYSRARQHFQHEARRLHGLGKKAVHVGAKGLLQAQRHTARRTTHATGDINKQRMIFIHNALVLRDLRYQIRSGCRIAQQQRQRMLVIHKMTMRVLLGQRTAWA